MPAVAVATPDVVGRRMAGPGIRAWHFAQELARHFDTVLIARRGEVDAGSLSVPLVEWGSLEARKALRSARVVIAQPHREVLSLGPRQKKVFDLFDPVILELDELYREQSGFRQRLHHRFEQVRLIRALRQGDLLLAATARQRDFYTGFYRANVPAPATYWVDRWRVIPFGAEDLTPQDGERRDDPPVILWGGGTWGWLDPELAIAAVEELNRQGVDCTLQFLGSRRPYAAAESASHSERPLSPHVRWNEEWIAYGERRIWLGKARIAMMLHRRTVESEYSIRTRLFDAIGAGLPVVATRGGFAAELVEREGLGVVVEPGDLASVVAGIRKLLTLDEMYATSVSNLARLRPTFSWSAVTRPLVEAIEPWVR